MIRIVALLIALCSQNGFARDYKLSHGGQNGAPPNIQQTFGYEIRVIAGEEYSLVIKKHPASNFYAWVHNFKGSTIIGTIQAGVALGKVVHVQAACWNKNVTFKYFKNGASEITTNCKVTNAYYD